MDATGLDGTPHRQDRALDAGLLPLSYREVFEAAPDGMLIVDAEGLILDANPAALVMFGYASDELIGVTVERLVPPELRGLHEGHRAAYSEDPRARPMGIGLELRGVRRDGTLFPVEISLSPLEGSDGPRIIATVRDLTDRLRLRRFGAESLRAMEEERRRIALELHDDTAQRLSGLLLMLKIATGLESEDERREVLENAREQLLEAAESVRRIARGLRPPALADAGLSAAIRGYVQDLEEGGNLSIKLDLDPVDHFLDPDERLVVYRVIQEALTNVLRHSNSHEAEVSIRRVGDFVTATVRDRGCGFAAAKTPGGRGLGLLGMEERAQMVGGAVLVESRPGEGTVVRLDVPAREGG
jgi:PAS domain S-box-containing protein